MASPYCRELVDLVGPLHRRCYLLDHLGPALLLPPPLCPPPQRGCSCGCLTRARFLPSRQQRVGRKWRSGQSEVGQWPARKQFRGQEESGGPHWSSLATDAGFHRPSARTEDPPSPRCPSAWLRGSQGHGFRLKKGLRRKICQSDFPKSQPLGKLKSGWFLWEEQTPSRGGEGAQEREGNQRLHLSLQGSPPPPPHTHLSSGRDVGPAGGGSSSPGAVFPRAMHETPTTPAPQSLLPVASEGSQCAWSSEDRGSRVTTGSSMSQLRSAPAPPTFSWQNRWVIKSLGGYGR
ncbi:uncharacterized protein LOC123940044 [Meles meles]|uniref:uncharacterized protein LOC123940044 n=1 Tax=Meles meles TaxID=9662 RepID=UPI001E69CD13|nr:uncharacterized protein LOC123940044 [Meles meles]